MQRVLFFVVLFASIDASWAADLLVGASQIDITPPVGFRCGRRVAVKS